MQAPAPVSVLLIVDMQVGLFRGPEEPHDAERVLHNILELIRRAREAGVPVLAARHTGPAGSPIAVDAPAWQLLPELGISESNDFVFNKTRPSCFLGTGLAAHLADLGVGELFIAGMKTQYCIDTTCRVAAELGIRTLLVADAHTCMETPVASAAQIIAHHNLTLSGPFVSLVQTAAANF